MTMQKERIESLRKDKLNKNFKQMGISTEFVSNFSIRLTKKLSEYTDKDLRESILNSLQRQMKKQLSEMRSFSELQKFLEVISFGTSKITSRTLGELEDQDTAHYLAELLQNCGKVSRDDFKDADNETLKRYEQMEHFLPSQIVVKGLNSEGLETEKIGYTLANLPLKKKYHDREWYLTRNRIKTPARLFDLSKLVSKIFFENTIEQFTLKNIDFYEYKAAEWYAINAEDYHMRTKKFPLPTNEDFRIKLLDTLNRFNMFIMDVEMVEDEDFNKYAEKFEVKTNAEETSILNMSYSMEYTMMREFINQTSYIKEKVEREIKVASDYAKSFETKKNINKQTLAVMENNVFLSKYGYVEIDNDVSLEKFAALEKEYEQLMTKIYIPKNENGSFRIKKLGNHKAAGLYYSSPVRATIFDLDSPDAYCHELAHQIDDTWATEGRLLSETIRFRKILDMYGTLVEKNVESLDAESAFLTAWKGNTKYNASYYLQPTEIFARSFELYLWNKGIQTSFLKSAYNGPIHPKDEEYLKEITVYFDELFSGFKADEPTIDNDTELMKKAIIENDEQIKIASSSSSKGVKPIQKVMIEEVEFNHSEQLSLF